MTIGRSNLKYFLCKQILSNTEQCGAIAVQLLFCTKYDQKGSCNNSNSNSADDF